MADEYSFKPKKCYCGLDLAGKKAEIIGLYRGVHPMGKCPSCGTKLALDAPPVEPVMPVAPAKAPVKKATSAPK